MFNCSESPISSFFLVVFFFLSFTRLTHSFLYYFPYLSWCYYFFRNYDGVNNIFLTCFNALWLFQMAYAFFWSGLKKSSSGTPPVNGVGILFSLTYQPIFSRTSFLETLKPHFSINLRHSAIIPLHGRGEQLADPSFGFVPLSIPSHV